jgi:proton glutamate symport protein
VWTRVGKTLLHPATVLAAVAAGIAVGASSARITALIEPVGTIYLTFLQMIAAVLLPMAIITSLGELAKKKQAGSHVVRTFLMLCAFMAAVSAIVIAVSVVSRPVLGVDFETKKAVSRMLLTSSGSSDAGQESHARFFIKEIATGQDATPARENWVAGLVLKLIPTNIVASLARGETLRILLFSLVVGFMLPRIPWVMGDKVLSVTEGFSSTARTMTDVSLYALPFGMMSLMAVQFRSISPSLLLPLLKFVSLIYLSCLVLFVIASLVIWRRLGGGYFAQFRALKNALVIAVVSQENLPALPATFAGLKQLDLDEERTNLVISLFFFLSDFAYLIAFTAAACFTLQLYDVPLTVQAAVGLVFLTALAAVSALGMPDILAVGMVGLAVKPLGLPADAVTLLLLVLGPVLYPVLVMVDVYISCAAAVVIARR